MSYEDKVDITRKAISNYWYSNFFLKAIYEGKIYTFVHVEDGGFDVVEPITGGWSYLQVACYLNRTEFVEYILDRETTDLFAVSPRSGLHTALHIACNRGHSIIVNMLLRHCRKGSGTHESKNTARPRLS